ncbi:hypothetical protein [Segnochrobactrum spirostomi]|uniref:Uncharacterized protein n=1 Tax=Segnochrobactrum spirostomi TaxID=2608987 RepID=A0A6A7Y6S4_9HYPH|nr:hypothetical protein [Segnochrobactrum spirostomi]MQT13781.1 hypothetical protein [Segnochrobactrum spirostomi]
MPLSLLASAQRVAATSGADRDRLRGVLAGAAAMRGRPTSGEAVEWPLVEPMHAAEIWLTEHGRRV